ncbi:ATP-binding cassette domain-containing protein [Denitratimonas sp. CY0512]|uniref:ABC transporter ATP-binding protein n=1 Tax=Denitratimonas sp. CY0512 TaxID=3131940 RepID=UPI00309CF2F8
MTAAIELSHVEKSFGDKRAVRDLSLSVPRGALYGIIGPNGAGKSTTLRMMLSILFPDSGSIRVLGGSALAAKDRIGYLPEERGVYRKMKVGDFLLHMAVLKGMARAQARNEVTRWLERMGLGDTFGKRCEELSKGMQQKVQYIAAVIQQPELLILDEPFSGLDPVNMRLLRELILEQHASGTTVLFSTHVMFQAEQLCEHIVMIHNGEKVLDDPLAAIRARHTPRALDFEPLNAAVDVQTAFRAVPGIERMTREEGRWRLDFSPDVDVPAMVQAVAAQVAPARLELVRPSLEDVFVGIATAHGGNNDAATQGAA